MLAVAAAVRELGDEADPLAVANLAKLSGGRDDNERRALAKQAISTLRNRGLLPPVAKTERTERRFDPSLPLTSFPGLRVPRATLRELARELWLEPTASLSRIEAAIASLSRADHRTALRQRLLQAAVWS